MGAVLLTIVLVLAGLGAVLVALAFVPADFAVSARTGAGVRFRVRWLFGLVRLGEARPRQDARRPQKPPEAAGRRREKRERARARRSRKARPLGPARTLHQLLAIDGLMPRIVRLVRELIRSLGWRHGRLAVRAGTGDPATTGELCGLVGPLLVWLPRWRALRVQFEPDFAGAMFEAEAEGDGRLVPARLLGALGGFALSRPGRQAIKVLVWDARR